MPTKDELRDQIAQLHDELSNHVAKIDDLESEVSDLEFAVADRDDEYIGLERDYDVLATEHEDTKDKLNDLSAEYERVLSQLRWTHTMLAISIEEQGGVVEIARSVAETYDGNLKTIKLYDLEEEGVVRVEVTEREIEPLEGEVV
jgi:chromosome segregation ATPase